jgi:hypothetical protein
MSDNWSSLHKQYPFIPIGTILDYKLLKDACNCIGIEIGKDIKGSKWTHAHYKVINEYFKLKTVVDDVQEWLK